MQITMAIQTATSHLEQFKQIERGLASMTVSPNLMQRGIFKETYGNYDAVETAWLETTPEEIGKLVTILAQEGNTLDFACKPGASVPTLTLEGRKHRKGQHLTNKANLSYTQGEIVGVSQIGLRGGKQLDLLAVTDPSVAEGAVSYLTVPDLAHYSRHRLASLALHNNFLV